MAKKSFVLYSEWDEIMGCLSDMEAGQLIKAVFNYVNMGEKPEFTGALKLAFVFISKVLDRDGEKYDNICQKRSAIANKRVQKHTKANKCIQVSTSQGDNENDNDNVNDNDNDNESENENESGSAAPIPPAPKKQTFSIYKNVFLTADEKQGLSDKYGNKTVDMYIDKLGTYIKTNNPKYDKDSHAIIIEKWIKEDKEDCKQVFGEEAEHIDIDKWYEQAESYDPEQLF